MSKKPNPKPEMPIAEETVAADPATVAKAHASHSLGAESNIGWAAFDPSFLSPPTTPPPRFPIELIPTNLRSLIVNIANQRLLSVDYVAASVLTACSGAIGNRARLLTFDGIAEPLAIYTTLVGPASTGKSLAIGLVEGPIVEIDNALQRAHRLMIRGADQKLLEKFDHKLRETVARRLLLEDLPSESDVPNRESVVSAPGLMLSEFTGAGLLDELRTGIDGRFILAHEINAAFAYGASNQGQRSRGLILEGYDGKQKIVRTKTEGKVTIPSLWISILGAIQPKKLPTFLDHAYDGLAARMWWIFPDVEPDLKSVV
jgi:hypothetical protein